MQEHLLQNGGVILHGGILFQKAHLHIGIPGDGPGIRFQLSGQDLQKGGLAGAVDADDAHLVPLIQVKIHVLQQLAAAEINGQMLRR